MPHPPNVSQPRLGPVKVPPLVEQADASASGVGSAPAFEFLAEALLDDIRNAPPPADVDFNIPSEIEAEMLTGMISRLLFWWLENANDYTAEQMAAMIYKALYRKEPPRGGG